MPRGSSSRPRAGTPERLRSAGALRGEYPSRSQGRSARQDPASRFTGTANKGCGSLRSVGSGSAAPCRVSSREISSKGLKIRVLEPGGQRLRESPEFVTSSPPFGPLARIADRWLVFLKESSALAHSGQVTERARYTRAGSWLETGWKQACQFETFRQSPARTSSAQAAGSIGSRINRAPGNSPTRLTPN